MLNLELFHAMYPILKTEVQKIRDNMEREIQCEWNKHEELKHRGVFLLGTLFLSKARNKISLFNKILILLLQRIKTFFN